MCKVPPGGIVISGMRSPMATETGPVSLHRSLLTDTLYPPQIRFQMNCAHEHAASVVSVAVRWPEARHTPPPGNTARHWSMSKPVLLHLPSLPHNRGKDSVGPRKWNSVVGWPQGAAKIPTRPAEFGEALGSLVSPNHLDAAGNARSSSSKRVLNSVHRACSVDTSASSSVSWLRNSCSRAICRGSWSFRSVSCR